MFRKTVLASLLASSAIALAVATPASADKTDRAREAIAAAEAKVHTAESIGTSTEAPRETAQARAALATAKEDLKAGHKSWAIDAAIQAQALADTAIGELQKQKDASLASARADQREGVAAAQDQAASAQQQAAQANARADAAQQAAATSAADAAAARNAAAAAAQTPATVETTVTTQQPSRTHSSTKTHVTRRTTTTPAAPPSTTTTTTQVTQP